MIPKASILRVARPTDQLREIAQMYVDGLGFEVLFEFQNHAGFDGVIIGQPNQPYHLEFTHHTGTVVGGAPTEDNLLIFFVPDHDEWMARCVKMLAAGFAEVKSYNPYWDQSGKTFEDLDGYRVVIENSAWME